MLVWWKESPRQRRLRLILFTFQCVVTVGILWLARGTLGPYIVGLALAYLLSPIVDLLERLFIRLSANRQLRFLKSAARTLAVFLAYLMMIALIAGFMALVIPLITEQAKALWQARNAIWEAVSRWGDSLIAQYRLLPDQVKAQTEESLAKLSTWATEAIQQALEGTVVAITYTASLILAILIIPFWTFYLLKDMAELKRAVLNMVPMSWQRDFIVMAQLLDNTLSSYLRGQLLLGLVIGVISTIGLTVIGVRFSFLLGFAAGVLEMVPNIGPIVSTILAILVALAQDPGKALATVIFSFVLQQLENLLLTPRVLGSSVKLHPVVVMIALVIGSELGGVLGLFLAPVAVALVRDFFKYAYYRLADQPVPPEEAMHLVYQREGGFSIDI